MGQYRERSDNRGRSDNNEIGKILDEIGKLEMLKDLSIKLIADENGYADKIAHTLRNMKTAQLRRFFGAIKLIERTIEEENSEKAWDEVEAEFYLLKPKIAYAKGRKLIPEEFYQVLKVSLNKINVGTNEDKIENFKRFVKFLESIVAYHKFYGGD
ncbi:type III-A CRISPR-associated protein Csm2 [Methanosarcina sp. Z-7115]|uniref:CRISPR system Cms protein Csm2 n=1 Tax=Methanosarcina baikalica TaxID=3073890 RepID=A0ABU2D4A5_9EURY|nr:type III-A CRISPR-associated protein Csm2 [Methanosarcina sp. Z-7115]MDR7666819.1 type III-A CRISPR-associated protein Csm2 [Methanosarcina sp. Z-7115]